MLEGDREGWVCALGWRRWREEGMRGDGLYNFGGGTDGRRLW